MKWWREKYTSKVIQTQVSGKMTSWFMAEMGNLGSGLCWWAALGEREFFRTAVHHELDGLANKNFDLTVLEAGSPW